MTSNLLRFRSARGSLEERSTKIESGKQHIQSHVDDVAGYLERERARQANLKSMLNSPAAIFYLLVLVASVLHLYGKATKISPSIPNSAIDKVTTRQTPQHLFVSEWTQHMLSHPIQPSDRLGFAEMGLRTRVYARLLEAQSVAVADDFERNLWPFVPRAKQMRLAHFGPEPPQPVAYSYVGGAEQIGGEGINVLKSDVLEGEGAAGTGSADVDLISSDAGAASDTSVAANADYSTDADIDDDDAEGDADQSAATEEPETIITHGYQKGIVMSLGRSEVRFALQFLHMLRFAHNSTLPVELYYYGDDDLPEYMRDFLEQSYESVRTVDLERMNIFDPTLTRLSRQGWALKPFALLATNFTEVILADADVVFLTKPEDFFEVEGYKKTGTLFFHDRDHYREGASQIIRDFLNDQLGAQGPSQRLAESQFWKKRGIYEQESGIVVANKKKRNVFSALFFAAWQNIGSIRERTTYRVFWGDKESYWLAFELAGFPYYFVEHYAGGVGSDPWNGQFCSDHPLHFIPEPSDPQKKRPGKAAWFNGSLMENKGRSDTIYLTQTKWMTGAAEWTFYEEVERWCIANSTYGGDSIGEVIPSGRMELLTAASRAADIAHDKLSASIL
jgi:hypothetical protein